jgi:hypothetical protein
MVASSSTRGYTPGLIWFVVAKTVSGIRPSISQVMMFAP